MGHKNNRIRELREARHLTVDELAERARLTVKEINRLESAKPQNIMINEAVKIAHALDVGIRELMYE